MKNLLALALAASTALSASSAFAGGPVVVEDVTVVEADKPASSIGVLPLLLGAIIIGAVLLNDDDEDEDEDEIIVVPVAQ